MELWDILDENGNPTGRIHNRKDTLPEGEYHLVVEVAVINSDNKLLLMYRHPEKLHGDCWEISGGSAISGEDSLTAAQRELSEETGINLPFEEFHFIRRKKCKTTFQDVYYASADVPIEKITFQEGETTDAMWVTKEEFIEIVESGKFCDHLKDRYYEDILKLFR